MSMPEVPPPEAPPPLPPPPQGASGCGMVLLIVIGIVLLLPGLCSIILLANLGSSVSGPDAVLWLIAFCLAGGGIALIVLAVRNRPRAR